MPVLPVCALWLETSVVTNRLLEGWLATFAKNLGLVPCAAAVGGDLGRSDPDARQCPAVFLSRHADRALGRLGSGVCGYDQHPHPAHRGRHESHEGGAASACMVPLVAVLLLRLANSQVGGQPLTASESALSWALLLVNSVSLAFDALDTWSWCRGERDVPGSIPPARL